MKYRKIIFILLWLIFIVIPVLPFIKEFKSIYLLKNQLELIRFIQRLLGVLAFILLSIQIILGTYVEKLLKVLGKWMLNFYHFQSVLILLVIVFHPLVFVYYLFKIKGVLDPFYVFTDLCLLCKGNFEYFYNFGRIAFWLIMFSVFVTLFKNSSQFLQKHASKLHCLNYLAFYLIILHAKFLGTDILVPSFKWVYWGVTLIITLIILKETLLKFLDQRAKLQKPQV